MRSKGSYSGCAAGCTSSEGRSSDTHPPHSLLSPFLPPAGVYVQCSCPAAGIDIEVARSCLIDIVLLCMLRSSRCRTVLYHPNPIGPHLYPSVHDIRSTASPRSACRPVDEPVRRARSPCPPRRAPTAPFFLSSLRIRFPRHWTAPRARWRACGRYLEFTPALNHPHRPRANDPRAIRCLRGARGRSATYASRATRVLIPLWRERSVLQPPPPPPRSLLFAEARTPDELYKNLLRMATNITFHAGECAAVPGRNPAPTSGWDTGRFLTDDRM